MIAIQDQACVATESVAALSDQESLLPDRRWAPMTTHPSLKLWISNSSLRIDPPGATLRCAFHFQNDAENFARSLEFRVAQTCGDSPATLGFKPRKYFIADDTHYSVPNLSLALLPLSDGLELRLTTVASHRRRLISRELCAAIRPELRRFVCEWTLLGTAPIR